MLQDVIRKVARSVTEQQEHGATVKPAVCRDKVFVLLDKKKGHELPLDFHNACGQTQTL